MESKTFEKERRSTGRVPVSVDAIVYYNSLLLTDCTVRNLSMGGAFIFTGGTHLPDRALIDVSLNVPATVTPLRLSARVMRANEEGVGVMLQDVNANTLRQLIQTLYAA